MTLKHNTLAFGVLAAAFAASALYHLYRSTLKVPEHAAFLGLSALVLTDKRWAWGIFCALVVALLWLGVLWYYPVVVPARIEAGAPGRPQHEQGVIYGIILRLAPVFPRDLVYVLDVPT